MYGLDESVDLSFMVGKELDQVCVGLYQVILNFSDRLTILIESNCELQTTDGANVDITYDKPNSTTTLVRLLGKKTNSEQLGWKRQQGPSSGDSVS